MKRSHHPARSDFSLRFPRRSAARHRRAPTPARSLSMERLEERRLLAVVAAFPPGTSNLLDAMLAVVPDKIKKSIPDEIEKLPGTTVAYQALPQETNEVTVDGNALNFFLLLKEGGDNIPLLRVGPTITEDLIDDIKVGLVDLVGDVELPIADLAGIDLGNSSAIVPNPQAIAQFFPFFKDIADGLDSLLDFGVPPIKIEEVKFPKLEIPDLGLVCPCEILPEFTLIPEVTLFDGFTIKDALPEPLVDIIKGISEYIEGIGPGAIYVNTLDGNDSIDTSGLTGIEQNLFGGRGNDILLPGGGQQPLEALINNGIDGVVQPPISVYGGRGRDTIVVNRRFTTDKMFVDGGDDNDILKIDGSSGNDIIELKLNANGELESVNFLAPNPNAGRPSNAIRRLTMPRGTVGGTFTLTFDPSSPQTTAPIDYDASASDIETALVSLATIGNAADIHVDGDPGGPWDITFQGSFAGQSVAPLVADGTNLLRGGGTVTVIRTSPGSMTEGDNEIQQIALPTNSDGSRFITGGTFTLTYDNHGDLQTTAPIRYSAPPIAVQQSLTALDGLAAGDVRVTGSRTGGWNVEFTGAQSLQSQSILTADGSGLTGGVSMNISPTDGTARMETVTLPGPHGANMSLGGDFSLSLHGDTSVPLPPNATASQVESALADLTTVGQGNVKVTGPSGGPYQIALSGTAGLPSTPLIQAHASKLTGGVTLNVDETTAGHGTNEQQKVVISGATGGTFQMTFLHGAISRTTDDLPFDATVGEIQSALENLTSIGGPQNVIVSGMDGGPWNVEFTGALAAQEQSEISIDTSGLTTSGTTPITESVTETVAHVAGANEVQTISLLPTATGGSFTLTFAGETTSPLPYDATAAQLQQTLQALASMAGGTVQVTSPGGNNGTWEVEFTGRFAATDPPLITGDVTDLSGGFADHEINVSQTSAGANELQVIKVSPSSSAPGSGTFRLSLTTDHAVRTTDDLDYNASAAEVQSALNGVTDGNDSIHVTGSDGGPWTVEFTNDLARKDITLMRVDTTDLSRNAPVSVARIQNAGPSNELQTVTLPALATGGGFTLTFDDAAPSAAGTGTLDTTGTIPYNASPSEVEAMLRGLSNIDAQDVSVRGGVSDPVVATLTQGGGSKDEQQRVSISPLAQAGTYTLSFQGETTIPLAVNATASQVADALEALSTIEVDDVQVTSVASGQFLVQFVNGLGGADQPLISADGANLTLYQHGPWMIRFAGQYGGKPLRALQADGSDLQSSGLNPEVAVKTRGSNGDPLTLHSTTFSQLIGIEQLQIEGNGGDDMLIVDGAHDFPLDVLFDGGDGIDQLTLISNNETPTFTSPIFPDDTQGVVTMDGSHIQLSDVEGGITLDANHHAGEVHFSGTDEANDIRLAVLASGNATMARDGQVTTTLANFNSHSTLHINGQQGEDVIAIAPGTTSVFDAITVDGGGPSGRDQLLVEGTFSDDEFTYTANPDDANEGAVTLNGVAIGFADINGVTLRGRRGNDRLTVHEPAAGSHDNVLFHPAVANDGSFQFTSQADTAASAIAYAPVVYAGIEERNFNTGSGNDALTASTQDLPGVNSTIEVDGGQGITVLRFGDQPTTFTHDLDGSDLLSLEVGTSVDEVTVQPGPGVAIAVNTSVDYDTLTYQPFDTGPISLNLAESQIHQSGVGDVTFTSTEHLILEGIGNALSVRGIALENAFVYTPNGPASGRITHTAFSTVVDFAGITQTFSILGGAAVSDQVEVIGSFGNDALQIGLATRQVRTINPAGIELKAVVLDPSIERVGVDAGPGDDLIRVTVPDQVLNPLAVDLDGGMPDASDRFVFVDTGTGNLVVHREGSGQRSGSISIDDLPPVAYKRIERVDILPIDPVTGGTGSDGQGRVVVLDTDVFEQNNDRKTATPFSDLEQATTLPAIATPARVDEFGHALPGDEDWYRYTATRAATLRFELKFDPVANLVNGAAGLPGDGQLRVDVYDADGNLIDRLANEGADTHTVGVEQGEDYYLRVRGATPEAINRYQVNVIGTDTLGPRVKNVFLSEAADFDLFAPKPSDGPTPPVTSLTVEIEDPVARRPGFMYEALERAIAESIGHFQLVGDHSGPIAIETVQVVNDPRIEGELATASIQLQLSDPLPDDRYTLTVSDALTDPVGNHLDGESDAETPHPPSFPSGDGVAGGNFHARFTVDSRPEVGTVSQGLVYVDINGNAHFDPEGTVPDVTNRDFVFQFGSLTDTHFAGNFADPNTGTTNGFDKLGVFGLFQGRYSFLLDTDDDGVGDFVSLMPVTYRSGGVPVAGDFAPNHPGDEIGLFDGSSWYLDQDGSGQIDVGERILSNLRGLPVVGDFNGDGNDDLATFNSASNQFTFDLDRDGLADATLSVGDDVQRFPGLSGYTERPLSGDVNLDGIDDLGLWARGRQGVLPRESGQFFFLVSDRTAATPADVFDTYSPMPLGNDRFIQFGDDQSLPVFGNFDPPLVPTDTPPILHTLINTNNSYDVNDDGQVTALDALIIINAINRFDEAPLTIRNMNARELKMMADTTGYLDTSGDGTVSALDALRVINHLNDDVVPAGEKDGENADGSEIQDVVPVDLVFKDDDVKKNGWLESDGRWQRLIDQLARGIDS